MKHLILLVLGVALALSCSGGDLVADAGSTVDGGSAKICSTTDGRTACGSQFCEASQYCDAVVCLAGCQSSSNCAVNFHCDKAGATGLNNAGVCRACSAFDAGSSACNPVGNYTTAPASSNPAPCSNLTLGKCSVTNGASATSLTIGCDGNGSFASTICTYSESSCTCSASFTVMGAAVTMTGKFNQSMITLTANGVLCEYTAVR